MVERIHAEALAPVIVSQAEDYLRQVREAMDDTEAPSLTAISSSIHRFDGFAAACRMFGVFVEHDPAWNLTEVVQCPGTGEVVLFERGRE